MPHHKHKKRSKRGTGKYRRYRDDNQRQKNIDRNLARELKRLRKDHPNIKYKIVGNSIEKEK